MIRVVYLNVDNGNPPEVLRIKDELETYYKLIGCTAIDVITRRINGKNYHIICDDEILLNNKYPKIGLWAPAGYNVYGNIIVAGFVNAIGDFTSLSEEDCNSILSAVGLHKNFKCPEGYYLLKQDYLQ